MRFFARARIRKISGINLWLSVKRINALFGIPPNQGHHAGTLHPGAYIPPKAFRTFPLRIPPSFEHKKRINAES
jgi:hypothetical protein